MLHHGLLHFTLESSALAPNAINSPAVNPQPVVVERHRADVDGARLQ